MRTRQRQKMEARRKRLAAMTPEELAAYEASLEGQRAKRMKELAQTAGRKPGFVGIREPAQTVQALATLKFRVKEEYKNVPEAVEVAGLAQKRIVDVMMGKVFSRKAPSVLKAAIALRQEICEPVVTETHHTGNFSLTHAVAQAAGRIPAPVQLKAAELKALARVPRAEPEPDKIVEAEVVPIKGAG